VWQRGNPSLHRSKGAFNGHRRPLLRGTQKLRHAVFFAPIDPADGRRCRRRHFRFAAHNGRDGATAIGTNDVVVIDERTLKVSARGRSEALRLRRALYYRYRDRTKANARITTIPLAATSATHNTMR